MLVKKQSIVEIEEGYKFLVLDIKEVDGTEIALLQSIETGMFKFAAEKVDSEKKSAELYFINDKELIKQIALEFDKQDGKI